MIHKFINVFQSNPVVENGYKTRFVVHYKVKANMHIELKLKCNDNVLEHRYKDHQIKSCITRAVSNTPRCSSRQVLGTALVCFVHR